MRAVKISALLVCLITTIVGCGQSSSVSSNSSTEMTQSSKTADDASPASTGETAEEGSSFAPAEPSADVSFEYSDSATSGELAGSADMDYKVTKEAPASRGSKVVRRSLNKATPAPAFGASREYRGAATDEAPAIKPPQYDHQAGTLTAGSIDDHKKFDEFRQMSARFD